MAEEQPGVLGRRLEKGARADQSHGKAPREGVLCPGPATLTEAPGGGGRRRLGKDKDRAPVERFRTGAGGGSQQREVCVLLAR